MTDLAAIQAEIMPRLERLLALAAGWAEPSAPGAEGRHDSAPIAVAERAAPGSAGGSTLATSGMVQTSNRAQPATETPPIPLREVADRAATMPTGLPAADEAGSDADTRSADPRTVLPRTGPFRLSRRTARSERPAAQHRNSDTVSSVAGSGPRQSRSAPQQPSRAGAVPASDPHADLPRFRLARRTPAEAARSPVLGVAGTGTMPPGVVGPVPAPAPFAPAGTTPGPAEFGFPRFGGAPPAGAGSLLLPSVAIPALSAAMAAPALTDDALEDALADLLERAALEAGVSPP